MRRAGIQASAEAYTSLIHACVKEGSTHSIDYSFMVRLLILLQPLQQSEQVPNRQVTVDLRAMTIASDAVASCMSVGNSTHNIPLVCKSIGSCVLCLLRAAQ